jgi:hypothetical protein
VSSGELEHAALGFDELAVGFEERRGLQRRGERGERTIGGDLPLAGVDVHLRADRGGADAVAVRNEVALDLHVPEHLEVVALVTRQERLEDLLVLVRELAAEQPIRRGFVGAGVFVKILDECPAFFEGQEEQGMIADLDDEAGVDLFLGEVRVALAFGALDLLVAGETDRAADTLLGGEDPVKTVERAFVERRVVLERAGDAGADRALRRAVWSVEQEEAVRPAFAREVREDSVDLFLDALLADEGLAPLGDVGLPRQIEETEATGGAPRPGDLVRAVVVEHVAHVPRGVATVAHGIGGEEVEVLVEREEPTTFFVGRLDRASEAREMTLGARAPLTRHELTLHRRRRLARPYPSNSSNRSRR